MQQGGTVEILTKITTFVWDYILLFTLVGSGIFFTIRLKGVQFTHIGLGFKTTFKRRPKPVGYKSTYTRLRSGEKYKDIKSSRIDLPLSPFQALATSVAAQIGTGNLVGAATAITMGGAGSIFWMWVSGLFGMATIFAEATMAQHYRRTINGEVVGGPVCYIKGAFKGKFGKVLACIFSILIILALPIAGNMVQINSITDAFSTAIPQIPKWGYGIIIVFFASIIFIGGAKRIVSFTEKVVPIMAILYITGAVVVLGFNYQTIGSAFSSIFVGAFNPMAVVGGVAGATVMKAMRFGVARGLFSNEAGMGSTPHAHALAKVKHPAEQGTVAMMGVLIDTFIVLTLTSLVLLSSGLVGQEGMVGIKLVQHSFVSVFGDFGFFFIAICLFFFAFSTIIAWYFFGVTNVRYLFGEKSVIPYSILVLVFLMIGSFLKLDLVWTLSDLMNGLMVIPNIIALIALSAITARSLTEYNKLRKDATLDEYTQLVRNYSSLKN